MHILRYSVNGQPPALGSLRDGKVTDLSRRVPAVGVEMIGLIERWGELRTDIETAGALSDYDLSEVQVLAPIPRPGKIFCIGLNYADHVAEAGIARPEHQVWFTKAQTAVVGPYDPIQLPRVSSALDYEGELVFVIGRRCRHVTAADALSAIFGYCIGNDVSVRDWQLRTPQFSLGKSFDTHAPFGPAIVTADEFDSTNLSLRTFVNGEMRQNSNTSNLIFNCAAQVAELSQAMTLEPGDVIFSGTPGGVGVVMKPPKYLQVKDRVRIEIEGLGFIENEVISEPN